MSQTNIVTRDSWKEILASAVTIFADLEKKGFGSPDVVIGGGTVLMFRFEHRLSRDIDFFMQDVQWLSVESDRESATRALAAAASNHDLLTRRLEQLSQLPPEKLAEGILPIGDFSRIMPGMIEAARRFMQGAGSR
jgi:hypothetical protein